MNNERKADDVAGLVERLRALPITPGPWRAHFEEAYFVTGPDLGRVAMMMNLKGAHGMDGRRSGDESAANCRAIAEVPAMLAALESLTARVAELEAQRLSSERYALELIDGRAKAELDAEALRRVIRQRAATGK